MALVVSIFCAFALLVQVITCQYIGNPLNGGFNFNGLPVGANFANGLAGPGMVGAGPGCSGGAVSGGSFKVTSTSPIAPTGVSVLAENLAIEGPLSVGGQLPFLGTVGVEGALPAIGSGAVSYGCGNGNVGITSEGPVGGVPGPYGLAGQAFGPALAGPGLANPAYGPGAGFGAGLAGPGYVGAGLAGSFGPGLAGPSFGPGVGFGNGLAGPAFGNSLAGPLGPGSGLGFNGVGGIPAGAAIK